MSRVTSLTHMPEQQLNRWIKRLALLFVVVLIAFVAFYAFDRFRMPAAPIVDRELAALEEAVRADPADVVARGQLAELYFAKGRFDEAVAQYTALIDAQQGGRARRASAAAGPTRQLGQYDQAIPDFEKVVEIGADRRDGRHRPGPRGRLLRPRDDRPGAGARPRTRSSNLDQGDRDHSGRTPTPCYALANALPRHGPDRPRRSSSSTSRSRSCRSAGRSRTRRSRPPTRSTGETELAEWAGAMAAFAAGDNATAEDPPRRRSPTATTPLKATVGLGLIAEAEGDTAAAAEWYRQGPRHRSRERHGQARARPGHRLPAASAPGRLAGRREQLMTASPNVAQPGADPDRPRPPTGRRAGRRHRRRGAAGAAPPQGRHPAPAPARRLRPPAGPRDLVPAVPAADPAPDHPGRDDHADLLDRGLRRRPADGRRGERRTAAASTSARPRATGSRASSTPAATRSASSCSRRSRPAQSTSRCTSRSTRSTGEVYVTDRPTGVDLHLRRRRHVPARVQPGRRSSRAGSRWASRSTRPATCTSPTSRSSPQRVLVFDRARASSSARSARRSASTSRTASRSTRPATSTSPTATTAACS